MKKLNRLTCSVVSIITIVFSLAHISEVMAQQKSGPDPLPSNIAETTGMEWRADSATATLERRAWQILPDAEIRREFGLDLIHSRHYRLAAGKGASGGRSLTVELFVFRHPEAAYGMLTINRLMAGDKTTNREEFASGNLLISLSSTDRDVVNRPELQDAIRQQLGGAPPTTPVLVAHLPATGRTGKSEVYLAGPKALSRDPLFGALAGILDFTGLPEMAIAEYPHASGRLRLLIVECFTPQSATDNFALAGKYLEALPPAERQTRLLRRIGNYIVIAAGINSVEETEKLFSEIKYEQKIYWSGRKLSDIPYEFRPPDPAALREMTKTGAVLVRSFMLIGLLLVLTMLAGVLVGGLFFYWRRYRRRRQGIENLFSDAGGTVLLNLDEYMLKPGTSPTKQLEESAQPPADVEIRSDK